MSAPWSSLLQRARPPSPDRPPAIRPQPRAAVQAPPEVPAEPGPPGLAPIPPDSARRGARLDEAEGLKPPGRSTPTHAQDGELTNPTPLLAPAPRAHRPAPEASSLRPATRPRRHEPAVAPEPAAEAPTPREPLESATEVPIRPRSRAVPAEPVEPPRLAPVRVKPPSPPPALLPARPATAASAGTREAQEPSELAAPATLAQPPSRAASSSLDRERNARSEGRTAAPPPTVHVHIGRVEVRAALPPAASQPQPAGAQPPRPGAALAEYLEKRWRGER